MGYLYRRPEVETRTGLSRTEIYRRIRAGTFPAPVRIGLRAVAWDADAIARWIAERIAAGAAPRGVSGQGGRKARVVEADS